MHMAMWGFEWHLLPGHFVLHVPHASSHAGPGYWDALTMPGVLARILQEEIEAQPQFRRAVQLEVPMALRPAGNARCAAVPSMSALLWEPSRFVHVTWCKTARMVALLVCAASTFCCTLPETLRSDKPPGAPLGVTCSTKIMSRCLRIMDAPLQLWLKRSGALCVCRQALESRAAQVPASRHPSPYSNEWPGTIAICALIKDERWEAVQEWIQYYRFDLDSGMHATVAR